MTTTRCQTCGAWAYVPVEDNVICCNARCDASWQATQEAFKTSLLGAACRQLVSDGEAM